MQQNELRHGQLQLAVLRPGAQHPETDTKRALQLQVPLVLLRAVRGVPSHGVGQRVQVDRRCPRLICLDSSRTLDGEPVPSPTPVGCFAPCVTLPENLFIPPLSFCRSLIWILFSLCSRCYSQNAKSEIEEVTHVSCLVSVSLDAALSAMKASHPFCPTKQKTNTAEKHQYLNIVHTDLYHCTVAVYFNVHIHICYRFIIINNIIVMEL